ncbi:MAG: RecX family transcriptional regulator [Clostridiales bacterium]|jgi:regulatory protein|nr:RecX family transcriptional regulator [Clostridiales bacterium]
MNHSADGPDELFKKACLRALKVLAYGPRSRSGMVDKLTQAGFSQETACAAAREMESRGYINDYSMAKDYAEQAMERKKHGKSRIVFDLKGKGIDGDTAERAVEDYLLEVRNAGGDGEEYDPELEGAVELLKNRMERQGLDPDDLDFADRNRLYGFLARRGYSSGVISKAFTLLSEEN